MLTLAEVIEAITGQKSVLGSGQPVTDVVIDSRLAIPGCLFVALQGEQRHGHEFVAAAFAAGAVAAIVEADLSIDCQCVELRGGMDPAPATLELPICLRVESSLRGAGPREHKVHVGNQRVPAFVALVGGLGQHTFQ